MRWYTAHLGLQAHAVPETPRTFAILRSDAATIFLNQLDGYRKVDLYAPDGYALVFAQSDQERFQNQLRGEPVRERATRTERVDASGARESV
jgi:hypothetical protein